MSRATANAPRHRQGEWGEWALSADEIAFMNEIKEQGAALGQFVKRLRKAPEAEPRWVNIGATYLRQGLLALTRAVEKPWRGGRTYERSLESRRHHTPGPGGRSGEPSPFGS